MKHKYEKEINLKHRNTEDMLASLKGIELPLLYETNKHVTITNNYYC